MERVFALRLLSRPLAARCMNVTQLLADWQSGNRSALDELTPIIYDEPANISGSQKIGSGGLFDIAVGYRVWHDLAVSVGFTTTSSKSDAQVTASIPNPIFTDQPVTRNLTASGLKHTSLCAGVTLADLPLAV